MVIRSRRGGSTLGCILTLVLFGAALYYGIHIGQVYLRYYRLLEEMKTQARLAPGLRPDELQDVLRRRLVGTTAELDLPAEASRFTIILPARTPPVIIIETRYRETVDLPLFKHTFKLHPRVEERL